MIVHRLGGIEVNEEEEWVKAIETGNYSVREEEGDWIWTIWIATGKSVPILIEFNKCADRLYVYRLNPEVPGAKVKEAIEKEWKRVVKEEK